MTSSGPTFTVPLDANVLAKPVTRTLLMLAADASGYGVTWSGYVEAEANRQLRCLKAGLTVSRLGLCEDCTTDNPS